MGRSAFRRHRNCRRRTTRIFAKRKLGLPHPLLNDSVRNRTSRCSRVYAPPEGQGTRNGCSDEDWGVPMKMVDTKIVDTKTLLKTVDTKILLMLFLALLVVLSALGFVSRFGVIPSDSSVTVGSGDLRNTPPTAPIPRQE